jgi:hypothetical protein
LPTNYHNRHVYFDRARLINTQTALSTMKTQPNTNWPNNNNNYHTNDTAGLSGFLLGNPRRRTALLATVAAGVLLAAACKDNGVIIIWWDETEGGDDASRTIPEFVISPLAKGNAYASSVVLSHSSDLKTMEELFGLSLVNNPIPAGETNNFSGFNNVATANDLSDLFVPGAIPTPASTTVTGEWFRVQPSYANLFLKWYMSRTTGIRRYPSRSGL